jgi:hypothetical protein
MTSDKRHVGVGQRGPGRALIIDGCRHVTGSSRRHIHDNAHASTRRAVNSNQSNSLVIFIIDNRLSGVNERFNIGFVNSPTV